MDTRIFYRYCKSLSTKYTVNLIAIHPKKEVVDDIQIIPFKRFKNKIARISLTWFIMFFKALKTKSKIYHFHDPELIPCGLLLRLFGKKVIYDVHENFAEDIFDKNWIKSKSFWFNIFNFFEKKACKHFKILLAEYSYEERYKKLNANYDVVLNYPDASFFTKYKVEAPRKSNRIYYIGILLDSRGLLEISEAIYLLQKKDIFVYFDVVGELYSSLEKEFIDLPYFKEIDPYVLFHGRKNLEEGYEISKDAAIGMCIIQKMKNSEYSYPTKMFEYMHIGLPQIISNFDLYKSVVEKHQCGICVDPTSSEEIATAIETILGNENLANQMRLNGLNNAHLYQWSECEKTVFKVYKSLE